MRLLANKSSRLTPERAFGTTFETIPYIEKVHLDHTRCFMITKQAFIEDDLAEIENILEEEWITEEDRFRSIFNGLDKATV